MLPGMTGFCIAGKLIRSDLIHYINTFVKVKRPGAHIIYLVLLSLGLFLIPNPGYACSKTSAETKHASCPGEKADTGQKDHCKPGFCQDENHPGDCKGSCANDSCGCSTSFSFFGLLSPFDIKAKEDFAEVKKQTFGFAHQPCSSGYFSIWLPPKIS